MNCSREAGLAGRISMSILLPSWTGALSSGNLVGWRLSLGMVHYTARGFRGIWSMSRLAREYFVYTKAYLRMRMVCDEQSSVYIYLAPTKSISGTYEGRIVNLHPCASTLSIPKWPKMRNCKYRCHFTPYIRHSSRLHHLKMCTLALTNHDNEVQPFFAWKGTMADLRVVESPVALTSVADVHVWGAI